MSISIFYNISVIRQFIGFIYVTFLPGFIVVKLLKLDKLDIWEALVFSAGFSLGILMLIGLLFNEFRFIFGKVNPLSAATLITALNVFVTLGGVWVSLRNLGEDKKFIKDFQFRSIIFLLISVPILTIISAVYANIFATNIPLILIIILISILFSIAVLLRNKILRQVYPLIILVIALSLIYHAIFVTEELYHYGSDVFGEYLTSNLIAKNGYWGLTNPYPGDISLGRTYSMLSVTILPASYSILLNIDLIWVLRLLFPTIFSMVPLGLYYTYKFLNKKYALISTFLFMSYYVYYTEMLGLNKQMIGELFLVLLLITIFSEKINYTNRIICFLFFSFGLIVSHYALAEIFLFFIFISYILLRLMRQHVYHIKLGMLLYFFVAMFCWYIYTSSSSVLDSILFFSSYIFDQLGNFFDFGARDPMILRGLGIEPPPSFWNALGRAFAILTEILICLGFIRLIIKKTENYKIGKERFVLLLTAMVFLFMLILIPGLSRTMNMTRFYHILLLLLAPLYAIGGEFIINLVFKRKNIIAASSLLLVIIVPYFLFQTGLLYEVVGNENLSLPLSKYRRSTTELYIVFGYVDAYRIYGAEWLAENAFVKTTPIYSDLWSQRMELRGYAQMPVSRVELITNTTDIVSGGIVYLSPINTILNRIIGENYLWNTSDIQFMRDLNKIYSNCGSEVYKNTP